MQYKVVSAVIPFNETKDTTSIGVELITKKVNEEIKKGWNVYGSLVVTTDVRAYRTGSFIPRDKGPFWQR